MTGSAWAQCPVCFTLVTDQAGHVAGLHAPLNRALDGSGQSADATSWGGPPVPAAPAPPTPAEVTARAVLQDRARATLTTITTDVVPAMDAYLDVTSPTAAQVSAQVRTLTRVVRALALLNRDLVRLAVRALDATD